MRTLFLSLMLALTINMAHAQTKEFHNAIGLNITNLLKINQGYYYYPYYTGSNNPVGISYYRFEKKWAFRVEGGIYNSNFKNDKDSLTSYTENKQNDYMAKLSIERVVVLGKKLKWTYGLVFNTLENKSHNKYLNSESDYKQNYMGAGVCTRILFFVHPRVSLMTETELIYNNVTGYSNSITNGQVNNTKISGKQLNMNLPISLTCNVHF